MNNKWQTILGVLGLLAIGWIGLSVSGEPSAVKDDVLYYRSPMHPWVTSQTPGQCTVCGMDLVPVFRDRQTETTNTVWSGQFSDAAVANLATRDLTRRLHVSGRLVPDRTKIRSIVGEVDGRIEKVHVDATGREVSSGDTLYTIYSPELREAERDYHLLFQQSQMNHSSRITAEHARLLQAMRSRLKEYGMTAGQIAQLPRKQDTISTSDIVSPVGGVVLDLRIHDGDRVSVGQHIMSIADVYQLWFEFDLYESDLDDVSVGQSVRIRVDGAEVIASISYVNDIIQGPERCSKARAVLRNATLRRGGEKVRPYTPGSYAEGWIELKSTSKPALPRSAFLNAGDRFVVFVQTDTGFVRREVEIGFRGDEYWEVKTGLEAEQKVVVEGSLLLESEFRL